MICVLIGACVVLVMSCFTLSLWLAVRCRRQPPPGNVSVVSSFAGVAEIVVVGTPVPDTNEKSAMQGDPLKKWTVHKNDTSTVKDAMPLAKKVDEADNASMTDQAKAWAVSSQCSWSASYR